MKYKVLSIIFFVLGWVAIIAPAIVAFNGADIKLTTTETYQLGTAGVTSLIIIALGSISKSKILNFRCLWVLVLFLLFESLATNAVLIAGVLWPTLIGCILDDFILSPLSRMFNRRYESYVTARITKQVITE